MRRGGRGPPRPADATARREVLPNNGMQRTALRAAADAESLALKETHRDGS